MVYSEQKGWIVQLLVKNLCVTFFQAQPCAVTKAILDRPHGGKLPSPNRTWCIASACSLWRALQSRPPGWPWSYTKLCCQPRSLQSEASLSGAWSTETTLAGKRGEPWRYFFSPLTQYFSTLSSSPSPFLGPLGPQHWRSLLLGAPWAVSYPPLSADLHDPPPFQGEMDREVVLSLV